MEPQLDVAEKEQLIQEITEDLHALEEQFFRIINREKELEYYFSKFKDNLKMRKNSLKSIPKEKFYEEYEVVAKLEKRVEAIEEMHKIAKEKIAAIKRYMDGSITMESLLQCLD